MLPPPDEALVVLGSYIRAARSAQRKPQLTVAKEAKVSRRQLDLLEKGGNVSVRFLLKVARYLNLREIPLDGKVQLTAGEGGVDLNEFLRLADAMNALVAYLRTITMDAMLPPSERKELKDTPALMEFISRHAGDAEGLARLAKSMERLASDPEPSRAPNVVESPEKTRRAARRRER